MAYLSRSFGPTGDDEQRRLASGNPLPAGSDAIGGSPAGGVAQAAVPGTPDSANIDHNAIRSFFDANKDQGATVLGGLADSLSQRISSAPSQMDALPTPPGTTPASYDVHESNGKGGLATSYTWHPSAPPSDAAVESYTGAAKATAARNLAGLSPLKTDVGQLGSMEGQQNLLSQSKGGQNYTPGQGRLDSWLSGSAANQSPSIVNNVNAGLQALTDNAGIYDPATQKKKNVEDYLNGR